MFGLKCIIPGINVKIIKIPFYIQETKNNICHVFLIKRSKFRELFKVFVKVYTCFLIHNKSATFQVVARHLIEGWQAAMLPNTFDMQQQQNGGCALEYQSPKLAFARPSSASTAAWQAENLSNSSALQQQMTGSHARNIQPLNPSHVRPSSTGLVGRQAIILPTNSEPHQHMHFAASPNVYFEISDCIESLLTNDML
jgi:hypothetical protein